MKTIATLLLAATFAAGASAQKTQEKKQKTNVPDKVTAAFKSDFPKAQKAEWEAEKNDFEVGFKLDSKEYSAVYDASGKRKETEVEIPASELPKAAIAYLKDKKVKEAARITDASGKTTYEAEVSGKDFLFDEKGNFIKSVSE
ncbi:PepSY-like domain-containing protein [Flavobacterium silvaticum]|uniref:Putative beta-lactamase-inhibitor-like PepSY-like domain-containing protein n=1 Tax=Flavobacterium silvaticum TaxID=1852020 RepID=A0A972JI62_9FLAO|nr:PepSY-like domain-containing protein [Flavobacterium silvaticum]NMH28665.1 hypothetical protein [Flavobacterium silvaticum]